MQLTPKAEQMLRKFAAGLAKANGQVDTSRYFSLTNPKETQLRNALLQSSEFLRLLPNVLDVDQMARWSAPVNRVFIPDVKKTVVSLAPWVCPVTSTSW